MTEQLSETFIEKAKKALDASHYTDIESSPFSVSRSFNDLQEHLKIFSKEIGEAARIIRLASSEGYVQPMRERVRQDKVKSFVEYMISYGLNPADHSNQEKALIDDFWLEVQSVHQSIQHLEEEVRHEGEAYRSVVVRTVKSLEGLNVFVQAFPEIHQNIPAEVQKAQNFTFRSHKPA